MYDQLSAPIPVSSKIHKGLMGQTRQKGSLILLTMPASVPWGPPGIVPGISCVPNIAYEPKIMLSINMTAIMI